jgi:xylan 1,4-beta-xylosidase
MVNKYVLHLVALLLACTMACKKAPENKMEVETVCNPVDISYRFRPEEPSRREAADPSVILFKDKYYLFASKSGGYWYSDDLSGWEFIKTNGIPTEEYAPTAIALGDTVYFLASSKEKSTIYSSTNPLSGQWNVAAEELEIPVWDPAFFLDDDNHLFLYWGCSNKNPIYGVEVDYHDQFRFIGKPKELIHANPQDYGWEVPGDYNTLRDKRPWIEGAWITKHNGKYYLQYSGPGTQFKSYADGVYVSDNPLGPFQLQPHNPFSYKPEGYASGAGHGSSFTDKYGNHWHMGTITISQKHWFERRLALYPAFLDDDGTYYCITKYGDFPLIVPRKKTENFKDIFPGWMILSYNKKVEVTSFIDSLPPANMVDENIRTYWSAKSGNNDEYAILDLGDMYDVYAIQVNFADHDANLFGRMKGLSYKYIVESSKDKKNWQLLIDKSENGLDHSHDYTQLAQPVNCRYLKINNIEVPDGCFSLSGLRVFGKGSGKVPEAVTRLNVARDKKDRRSVILNWEKSGKATGYNISFGIDKNKLYHNYMVYSDTTLTINILNANHSYYFSVEAFNENGVATGDFIELIE